MSDIFILNDVTGRDRVTVMRQIIIDDAEIVDEECVGYVTERTRDAAERAEEADDDENYRANVSGGVTIGVSGNLRVGGNISARDINTIIIPE